MDEIIRLSDYLKDVFANDPRSQVDTNNEVLKLQERITSLQTKLSNLGNYEREVNGSIFSLEVLNDYEDDIKNLKRDISLISDEVDEFRGVISLANEEIKILTQQMESINNELKEKLNDISSTRQGQIELQEKIRALTEEQKRLQNEINGLVNDRDFFESEIVALEKEMNADNLKLSELETAKLKLKNEIAENKYDNEAITKDKQEIENLNSELRNLYHYNNSLIILNTFFDLVDRIKNGDDYTKEEIDSVLKDISTIQLPESSLISLNQMIEDKKKEIASLEEKLSDENNYKMDDINQKKILAKYERLKNINNRRFAEINEQLQNLEEKIAPIRKNQKLQQEINKQIASLSVAFRKDSSNDQYYQEQFKGFYATLEQLKAEEQQLLAKFSLDDYEEEKRKLLEKKDRINKELVVIESSNKNTDKTTRYNRFKMNEDRIRLATLNDDLKHLENLARIFNGVTNAHIENIFNNVNEQEKSGVLVGNPTLQNESQNQTEANTNHSSGIVPIDYAPINLANTMNSYPKITGVKKASKWSKIKETIKKNLKKILVAVLTGVALFAGINSVLANNDNVKEEVKSTIQSEANIASSELTDSIDEIFNKAKDEVPTSTIESNNEYSEADEVVNYNFDIGDSVQVTNDTIYETSLDAAHNTNALNAYYPTDEARSISAIEYVSPDGTQHVTITDDNKDQKEILEKMGWTVESYNTSNDTRNVTYEGWRSSNDLEVSSGRVR